MKLLLVASLVTTSVALAQPEPSPSDTPKITVSGYLETYYLAHFQNPSNRITNLRGFDNRSRTFTLSNVAIDLKGEQGPVTADVMLQIGHTPSTYYLAETTAPGTGSVNTSSSELWKYVQTATVTVQGPNEIDVSAGLFTSPVGIEVIPVKDNWNWSRSNLFFGLPFYHTGFQVYRALGGGWTGKLHVYNGWNTVVDNNPYPSAGISAAYSSDKTTAQLLYLGGIERAEGAPEGKAWRNLFDALVQHAISDAIAIAAQGDAGIESNDIGTSSWLAVAGYLKYTVSPKLYLAARGDYFYEKVPDGASAIFWPVKWMASGTATLAYQPFDKVSVRLEYRHDHADGDAFFGGDVATDPMSMMFVPNRDKQDTATLGVTAWF